MKPTGASLFVSTFLLGGAAVAQTSQPQELEEVIVTGYRGSLVRAAEIKQDANAVVDVITAEDIGNFPDANIADSLQRMTGVQISRDRGGEGRFVSIRGLGSQFNMTTLNGRVIANDNAGRDFSFDVMPSEALQSVAVYKTPMASLTEGSIGGLIQMELLNPLRDPGLHIASSASGFFDDATEEITPRASFVISNTFAEDTIGAFISASYYERDWRADTYESLVRSTETVDQNGNGMLSPNFDPAAANNAFGRAGFPGIPSYQIKSGTRERTSFVGGLRFQPHERLNTTLDFFYSELKTPESSYSYNINFFSNDGWGRFENGVLTPTFRSPSNRADQYMLQSFDLTNIPIELGNDTKARKAETYMLGWNTNWRMSEALNGTFDIAYSKADRPNNGNEIFTVTGLNGGNFHWEAGKVPSVTCTLNDGRNCYDITNADLGLHFMEQKGEATQDEVTSVRLDFEYAVDAGEFSGIGFGAFFTDREKDKVLWKNPNGCAYCNGFATRIADYGINAVVAFPEGGYRPGGVGANNVWLAVDPQALFAAAIAARGRAFFDQNIVPVPELRSSSNVQEQVTGTYVQANFSGERWDGNVGVRYVRTSEDIRGHAQEITSITAIPGSQNFAATFSDVVPVRYENDYHNVLPSMNFTYRFQDNLQLRAAAYQAITRPTFTQLGPDVNWEVNSPPPRLTRNGNPELETVEANNFDLSLEWYGSQGSSASLAFFYKDITNFVTPAVFPEVHLGQTFEVTQPINGDTATLQGIELAVQQLWESGWGVAANYTYVDNQADVSIVETVNGQRGTRQVETQLDDVSDNTLNLSAFFERHGLSARLSHVYRSDYIDCGVCGPNNSPRTTAESAYLDFSGSYAFNEMWAVYLDAFNLTQEETHSYYQDEGFTHYYEKYPRRFEFGVRAKF